MFDRLTPGGRAVIDLAQSEARTLGHGYIGTEHLLLGLLQEPDGIAGQALRAAGMTADGVRAEVGRLVGHQVVSGPDADALRTIGIDVEQVRAHVEESFGPGALERARSGLCRHTVSGGHIPLSRRSKKVMELSLREALRLRDDHIGTEHILLALLREGEGLAVRMLADAGVRAQELRTSVLSALGKVA